MSGEADHAPSRAAPGADRVHDQAIIAGGLERSDKNRRSGFETEEQVEALGL